MKKIIALIISLLITTSLFAQDINWSKFNHAFSTKADYQETEVGLYAILQRSEEIDGSTYANYFSGIGGFEESGKFTSYRYELVSEKWTVVNDGWHIDQWLFALNLKQQLVFKLHRSFIKTFDSTILDLENHDETDEAYAKKVNELLIDWEKALSNKYL